MAPNVSRNPSSSVEVFINERIFKDSNAFTREIARRHLESLAESVKVWIVEHSPTDLQEFRRGVVTIIEEQGADVLARVRGTARHSWYVEHGRGPGRDAPFDLILAWVQRHKSEELNFNIVARHRRLFRRGINRRLLHQHRAIALGTPGGVSQPMFGRTSPQRQMLDRLAAKQRDAAFRIARMIGARGMPGHHLFEQVLSARSGQIKLTGQLIGQDIAAGLWG
jgi:hypothetical protein